MFEVALIEAAEVQAERDNKVDVEEADVEEEGDEEDDDGTAAKNSASRFCSII